MQIAILLLTLSLSLSIFAEEADIRRYELRDDNSIELKMPTSWKSELKDGPQLPYATITLQPRTGSPFDILISPIVFQDNDTSSLSAKDIRRRVQAGINVIRNRAIEKEVEIKELNGSTGPGYYYTVTDRAPKSGEYKYMTSGIVRVGNLAVSFTVLTNDGQQKVIDQALAILRNAIHKRKDQNPRRSAGLKATTPSKKSSPGGEVYANTGGPVLR